MSDVFAQVKEIVADALSIDPADVVESSNLVDDLGADSLSQVELVMKLEDAFDIEIPESELKKILTVKEIVNYIQTKKAA